LVPLGTAHHDDLVEAVRDGELWRMWYTAIPTPQGVAAEITRRLGLQDQGSMLPFAVIENASGKAVGLTTYMNIDNGNRRVEIGSTWYRRRVQRTALNTECKLLLLQHAFEQLQCIAVEFRTHFFNQQSRAGIERLGAKLDGVLRSHQVNPHPDAKGSLRDTCVYSVIAPEWPMVRAHLSYQLSKPRTPLAGA
jgi:RimJ/RimL family protein N-acetyltransferase